MKPPTTQAQARFRILHNGREIPVLAKGLVVGRAADCDIRLAGGLVSRRHASIKVEGDHLTVEDLGSRNGVAVNRTRIAKATAVAHGDTITIGIENFEVLDGHVTSRPSHLSTMPPTGVAPLGESDVDDAYKVTVAARLDDLSDREREVLELVVRGHTQKEIAEQLHVSVKTVETHRARLGEKLGCKSRAELMSYAISAGLLRGK